MAAYSGKPLVQKLGIKPGFRIFAAGAPVAYGDIVGKLPEQVTLLTRLGAAVDMIHVFATEAAALGNKLCAYRDAIKPDGMIWVVAEKVFRRPDRSDRQCGSKHRATARAG